MVFQTVNLIIHLQILQHLTIQNYFTGCRFNTQMDHLLILMFLLITSDITKNGYTLFPNPAKDQVQIYLNDFTQPVVMIIYDNAGKKIKEQTLNQQVTTIELPVSKGVYIMQLSDKDGNNKVRKKLMVE